jgi:phage baseplate assembly protein W
MTRLSFKDVGRRAEDARLDVLKRNRSVIPIGIKTPVELADDDGSLFAMHSKIQDQIRDNLRNLILTNHGERLGVYDLGANLRPLLSEYTNRDDFDSEAMVRINTAVSKWMPRVSLTEFTSEPNLEESQNLNSIHLYVYYSVPDLGIQKDLVEVILKVM